MAAFVSMIPKKGNCERISKVFLARIRAVRKRAIPHDRTQNDSDVTVTNLDHFDRKNVGGKNLFASKGSEQRINGQEVKLSTD